MSYNFWTKLIKFRLLVFLTQIIAILIYIFSQLYLLLSKMTNNTKQKKKYEKLKLYNLMNHSITLQPAVHSINLQSVIDLGAETLNGDEFTTLNNIFSCEVINWIGISFLLKAHTHTAYSIQILCEKSNEFIHKIHNKFQF